MNLRQSLYNHRLWQHPRARQAMTFGKYVGVQVVNYALDLSLYLLFLDIAHLPIWTAAFLSRTLSGVFTFVCHKFFTFKDGGTSLKREATIYFSILFLYAPIAAWLVQLFSHSLSPVPAKVAADMISVVITFNLTRLLVFPKASKVS